MSVKTIYANSKEYLKGTVAVPVREGWKAGWLNKSLKEGIATTYKTNLNFRTERKNERSAVSAQVVEVAEKSVGSQTNQAISVVPAVPALLASIPILQAYSLYEAANGLLMQGITPAPFVYVAMSVYGLLGLGLMALSAAMLNKQKQTLQHGNVSS